MKINCGFSTVFCTNYTVLRVFLSAIPILPCLLLLCPLALEAHEDSLTLPLSRGEHVFYTEFNTGYYYTEKNYTERFKSLPLRQILNLNSNSSSPFFQYMNMKLSLGYALTDWFEIEAFSNGVWFAQSGDGNKLRFSDPQIQRGGVGFRSQQNIVSKSFGLIPEFSFSFPFFLMQKNTVRPITDDGSIHLTPAFWLYGVIGDVLYPFGYIGFKWRSQSLSSMLQWKIGLMLKADIAEMGAYSYGFWSVIRDKSSGSLGDRSNLLKQTNAGSLKFFSANPGLIGFVGWLGWHFPYVTLRLSGDIDINGTYHSSGYTFLASIILELGSSKKNHIDKMFNEGPKNFEPQITADEESVNSIFENLEEDSKIQQEAEKALEEAEKEEEEKIKEEISDAEKNLQ